LLPDWYALYTALAKSLSDKPYHARSMTWLAGTAQRLKRVFNIDITECEKCQKHNVTIIACITAGDRSDLQSSTRYCRI
jgi:hypothetical protein